MPECQKCNAKTDLYLCKHCMGSLRRQLLSIPTLIDDLADAAIGNTRLSNESTRQKGFQSRTPVFDDRATDLIEEISDTIGGWARGTARIHGLMISPPVSWHKPWDLYKHTVKDFAMFLAAHVDMLAKDPEIGELCDGLRKYIKRAHGLVDRRMPSQFCGPCPATINDHRRCEQCSHRPHECATSLAARRGALEVTCPSCGAVHRVEALINALLAHADKFRCTIPDLNDVLRMLEEPVKIDTLYRWAASKSASRGRAVLKPAGYLRADKRRIGITRESPEDTPIYRVSDARKLREESIKSGRRGRPLKNPLKIQSKNEGTKQK
jgi:hypothetical protein